MIDPALWGWRTGKPAFWGWQEVTTATPIQALRRVFIFDNARRVFKL